MNAEIISIGTELLLGNIVDTNAAFLSERLAGIGIDVFRRTTVGDNPDRLLEAIKTAARRADLVIMSGGLGPTVDDVTYATIARLLDRPLVLSRPVLRDLKAYFTFRKVRFPPETIRQAYLPIGIPWIRNKVGTAPGLVADYTGKMIICLPGPPREIVPMFDHDIIPLIRKKAGTKSVFMSRAVKVTGLGESQVNGIVSDLLELKPPTTVGIYAKLGEVTLKIMAKARTGNGAQKELNRIERLLRDRLGNYVFGIDDETLEGAVGALLRKKRLSIALAESCTGGYVTHRLTNVSGSSDYLTMSVVAYSNAAKVNILGVSPCSLKGYGAVSREVALEMAYGAKRLAAADIGLALTGIAGPTGGTKAKPVGLVHIALVIGTRHIAKECRFRGSREEVKHLAAQVALDLIRRNI